VAGGVLVGGLMPGARRLLVVSGFFGLKIPAAPPRSPPTSCARASSPDSRSVAPIRSATVKEHERHILSGFIAFPLIKPLISCAYQLERLRLARRPLVAQSTVRRRRKNDSAHLYKALEVWRSAGLYGFFVSAARQREY
jgi:hypothetical protein